MLKFYLTTVIIWMFIIYCVTAIFRNGIIKKVGANKEKESGLFKKFEALFILSAVPIIRLFVVIVIIYIATCKQEDFDELMQKADEYKS